jgi:membrane-associated phospholipid phosphatase
MSLILPERPNAQLPILPYAADATDAVVGAVPAGAVFGVALFTACAVVAAYRQQAWEFPVLRALNALANRSALLDRGIHALTSRDLLQGVVFVSLLWFLWFESIDGGDRARLLTGTAAAALAGMASRVLQIVLPTHSRPLHTPSLGFVLPMGVEPDALNHYHSFPSDHGAVFFGLALVIFRLRPRLGVMALVWALIVDCGRVYDGYHYPSDILGAIGLAMFAVSVVENRWCHHLARRLLVLEQTWRPVFYMSMFVITYQIATLFDDVREIGRGFASVFLHHDPFTGA